MRFFKQIMMSITVKKNTVTNQTQKQKLNIKYYNYQCLMITQRYNFIYVTKNSKTYSKIADLLEILI